MLKAHKTILQKDLIITMVISLILGGGGGFIVGALTSSTEPNEPQMNTKEDSMHGHDKFMVNADEAPTVDVTVEEDAKSGYNVKILTTNFTFTPNSVNSDNVVGEGHAHLYVDGEKIGRLYAPDFHYDGSFEGTKTFSVTLNANDHSEYAVDGNVIDAEINVTHDGSDPNHNEMHVDDDATHSDM